MIGLDHTHLYTRQKRIWNVPRFLPALSLPAVIAGGSIGGFLFIAATVTFIVNNNAALFGILVLTAAGAGIVVYQMWAHGRVHGLTPPQMARIFLTFRRQPRLIQDFVKDDEPDDLVNEMIVWRPFRSPRNS